MPVPKLDGTVRSPEPSAYILSELKKLSSSQLTLDFTASKAVFNHTVSWTWSSFLTAISVIVSPIAPSSRRDSNDDFAMDIWRASVSDHPNLFR